MASGACHFGIVPASDWSDIPDWIDQEKAAAARKKMEEDKASLTEWFKPDKGGEITLLLRLLSPSAPANSLFSSTFSSSPLSLAFQSGDLRR